MATGGKVEIKLDIDGKSAVSQVKSIEKGFNNAGTAGQKGFGAAQVAVGNLISQGINMAISAVGTFVKDTLNVGKEFDSAMSQVAATMGTTTDQIQDLRDFALEMGSTTMFTATQAAEGLNYMALAGYDAQTSMEMLPTVLNLAAAGGMELAAASDMVTDAQSALGLTVEETTELVDKMAAASSNTNTSVEQLGSAILTIGGTAKDLAGGTTELAQALGLLADNGIKGAEGGTALRNIMIAFANGKFDKVFSDLGVSAYDAATGDLRPLKDIMQDVNGVMADMTTEEKNNLITKAFNARDLKAINALLGTNAERWDEVELAINGSWYTTELLSDAMSNAGLDLEQASNKLGELGVSADELHEALANSGGDVSTFTGLLQEAADGGVSYEEIVQALGGDLDALQTSFDETGGAAQQMAETMMDNLEGDMTYFGSALEGFQIALSSMVEPMLRPFVQLGTGIIDTLHGALESEGLKSLFGRVGNNVKPMIDAFKTAGSQIAPVMGGLAQSIGETLGGIIEWLSVVLPPIISTITPIVTGVVAVISNGMSILFTVIGAVFEWFAWNVFPTVRQILEAAQPYIEAFVGFIVEHLPMAQATVETVLTAIGNVFSAVWPYVAGIVGGAVGAIIAAVHGFQSVVSVVSGVFNAVKRIIDTIKGFFNFSVPHPHIPLPHFQINPSGWKVGDLLQGKIPTLGINWYAKGGVFNGPSIIGVGEAGPEAVIPLSSNRALQQIGGALGGSQTNNYIVQNIDFTGDQDVEAAMMVIFNKMKRLGAM